MHDLYRVPSSSAASSDCLRPKPLAYSSTTKLKPHAKQVSLLSSLCEPSLHKSSLSLLVITITAGNMEAHDVV